MYLDDVDAPTRGFVGLWPPSQAGGSGEPWYTSKMWPMWGVFPARFESDEPQVLVFGLWSTKTRHDEPPPVRTVWVVGWDGRQLVDHWRGSALSWPLDDARPVDLDDDGLDELLAVEHHDTRERCRVAVYQWNGFGFSLVDHLGARCQDLALAPHPSPARCVQLDGAFHTLHLHDAPDDPARRVLRADTGCPVP